MKRNEFIKCLALFLFSTVFLYGVGETYGVPWLQFHFLGQYNDEGFYFSFSSLTPILGGLLIVALYETKIKRLI
ncbi:MULTISPECIES: hypothetical protein [Lysinibacillus]|uniref:Uncharacterized protein n=1 Tax=Lysinibacillus sphaericus TaxID=1421 RepID=A0A544UTD8_LYSSH|nr:MULTISPECIES: hypothetical protein [Lysinibacillus]MDD1504896.1 hypothetical protein [Lysinibacillus sp. CNPSo 3705]MEB2282412.1 hypothetical protein [Lysinibacillus xylanilyticus]TQR37112.1 hypothetical protein C7Y47_05320 [Lysinibacillus sp. SDF0037]UPW84927.1 hypothetical protein MY533_08790 [Lysinibacillus sp. Ag94]